MRIENPSRTQQARPGGGAARSGGGEAFRIDAGAQPVRSAPVSNAPGVSGIEALLALQSVDDPLQARRRSVKRGMALLDTLEDLKADLIVGRLGESRINRLLALVGQARERSEPGLDALLDDIELRARVELAKLGR